MKFIMVLIVTVLFSALGFAQRNLIPLDEEEKALLGFSPDSVKYISNKDTLILYSRYAVWLYGRNTMNEKDIRPEETLSDYFLLKVEIIPLKLSGGERNIKVLTEATILFYVLLFLFFIAGFGISFYLFIFERKILIFMVLAFDAVILVTCDPIPMWQGILLFIGFSYFGLFVGKYVEKKYTNYKKKQMENE